MMKPEGCLQFELLLLPPLHAAARRTPLLVEELDVCSVTPHMSQLIVVFTIHRFDGRCFINNTPAVRKLATHKIYTTQTHTVIYTMTHSCELKWSQSLVELNRST